MAQGIFIVLDGNDGSGKATQSRLLAENLSRDGIRAVTLDFPAYERNFFGAFIGECLAGRHGDFVHLNPKIASTLYALDRLESSARIRAELAEGAVVIADRFASSNQIHQGGKIQDEEDRAAFIEWLDRMEHFVLDIPRPDLIVYLRVPLEISLELLQKKRATKNQLLAAGIKDTVEEDRTYLERSHETANWLASKQANWKAVNCSDAKGMRPAEAIQNEIRAIVDSLVRRYHINHASVPAP